jgi:quercetin dioxygenase-like cupin family protein
VLEARARARLDARGAGALQPLRPAVLEGELVVEPSGKEPITLKAGETGHFTPDVVHAACNGSDSTPAKVLVFLVVQKGKPLAEAAK